MIIEYIRYNISESNQKSFINSYNKASVPLLESDYCLAYDICQCVEDSSQFTVRIQWTSAEDHMQKFRSSKEFSAFFAEVKNYVNDIEEMRHYNLLESHAQN